jgi:hypothetical protein
MGKHGNTHYIELDRAIFETELSFKAKWLYTVLTELEHRFTHSHSNGWFYRSNRLLAIDSGMTLWALKQAKTDLIENGLVFFKRVLHETTGQTTSHYKVNRGA